jgi:hypothetical protein
LHDLLSNPENDQEYIERIEALIQHPDRRVELGKTLRNRLLVDHVGEGWLHRLTALYKETDRLSHRPGPIPVSTCSMANEDVGLSLWNVMANGKTNHNDALVNIEGARLNHTAFVAKEVGDYAKARRFAWRVLLANPCRRATWRAPHSPSASCSWRCWPGATIPPVLMARSRLPSVPRDCL